MQVDHEVVQFSDNSYVNVIVQKIGYSKRHWHSSMELLLVLENNVDLTFRDKVIHLKENDVAVINSNHIHSLTGYDAVLLVIQVSPTFLAGTPFSLQNAYFDCNSATIHNPEVFDDIREIMAKVLKLSTLKDPYEGLLLSSYLSELMHILFANFLSSSEVEHPNEKSIETLQTVINYIDEHFTEPLTGESIAKQVYLTPAYLSTFFEKNMGTTLSSYLRDRRIDHAVDLLMYTDDSIEEIAEKSGFVSARSFSDAYKKAFGLLPSQARKDGFLHHHREVPEFSSMSGGYMLVNKEDYFAKLDTYLIRQKAKEAPSKRYPIRRITIDPIRVDKYIAKNNGAVNRFCSVSRASDILLAPVQEMLKEQQQEIHFEYVKFHDIFDDNLQVYSEDPLGRPIYNFHMVDQVLDFLLSVDLKPMIQLSFMPVLLAKKEDADRLKEFGLNTVGAADPIKWENLVRAFVKHLILRYGASQLNTWIFTFWNESLTGLHFDIEDDALFYELYERSFRAVKDLLPNCNFASTSFVLAYRPVEDYRNYITYMKEHNCMADSFLLHFYPMPKGNATRREHPEMLRILAKNTDERIRYAMTNDDRDALSHALDLLLPEIPEGKKVYLTEWNLTPSHRELLNDTMFSATYIVRNILKNWNRVDSFGHWVLSDWITEMGFPDKMFHGGLGFFTYNDVKKPSYFAFLFASKLQKNVIYNGSSIIITCDDDHSCYQMLMYNYSHFSDLYADGFNFDFSELERYNVFPDTAEQVISFEMTGLINGEYEMIQHLVNREHGSSFDTWLRSGASEPTSADEIEGLQCLSRPMPFKHREQVEAESYRFHFHMQPHEIRWIQFRRVF